MVERWGSWQKDGGQRMVLNALLCQFQPLVRSEGCTRTAG